MSKKELEQLNELLEKFQNTYKKRYAIMGAVQLLLLDNSVDKLPQYPNRKITHI